MDTIKVAKDYFVSSQSSILIPNRDFGSRKFISIGLPKPSVGLPRSLSLQARPSSSGAPVRGKPPLSDSLSDSDLLAVRQKCESVGGESHLEVNSNFTMKSSTKQWLHPPDSLLKGHILYHVKFLGECAVDQPKGTEIVKDAIRKMKFNKHIKRAEGQKPPKVDLTISADGLTILDPKSKAILHQYPLHRISYCADDKSDKKMFTFIAKAATTNNHFCYVFVSDKCAEEITLTVGQAFDLAYKRFLESGTPANGDTDYKKQSLLLQRKVQSLQFENDALRKRVEELEKLKDRSDLDAYLKNNQLQSLSSIVVSLREESIEEEDYQSSTDDFEPTPQRQSVVGRRLENLMLDNDTAFQTNGSSISTPQSPPPLLSPPPAMTRTHRQQSSSLVSPNQTSSSSIVGHSVQQQPGDAQSGNPFFSPSNTFPATSDPFGMGAFNPASNAKPDSAFGASSEQELHDIQAAFSRGLSFGTDDFSLDELDPLSHRL